MVLMTVRDRQTQRVVDEVVMDEHESLYKSETASRLGFAVDIRQLSKEEVGSMNKVNPVVVDILNFLKDLAF